MRPRLQCAKCPWKKGVDPFDIPNGYDVEKHEALAETIQPGLTGLAGPRRTMACHETPQGGEMPCVGWLVNQIGPGNNLALRIAVSRKEVDADVRTVGPQHRRFEDTLPRKKRNKNAGETTT